MTYRTKTDIARAYLRIILKENNGKPIRQKDLITKIIEMGQKENIEITGGVTRGVFSHFDKTGLKNIVAVKKEQATYYKYVDSSQAKIPSTPDSESFYQYLSAELSSLEKNLNQRFSLTEITTDTQKLKLFQELIELRKSIANLA